MLLAVRKLSDKKAANEFGNFRLLSSSVPSVVLKILASLNKSMHFRLPCDPAFDSIATDL